jgi:hypothetical protein
MKFTTECYASTFNRVCKASCVVYNRENCGYVGELISPPILAHMITCLHAIQPIIFENILKDGQICHETQTAVFAILSFM